MQRWFLPVAASLVALLSGCGEKKEDAPAPGAACAQASSEKNVCLVAPGEFPPSDCDPSAKECGSGGACTIDQTKCGSASTCLPLAKNDGRKIVDLRIRRLNIAAPDALAALPIQRGIITRDIDMANKECGEAGAGTFNWLLRLDKTKSTLTTGGAPPTSDPFTDGYCFFNQKVGDIAIRPATDLEVTQRGDTFSSASAPKLNLPIFRTSDPKSLIVLPLSNVSFRGVTLSENANCIGSLNEKALGADCADDPAACSKWNTAGAVAAFITLEEADQIAVSDLGVSLCVVLTKSTPVDAKCERTGASIKPRGDYCSKTGKACDCGDSFWLAATFAASAITINDGASVPQCNGGTP